MVKGFFMNNIPLILLIIFSAFTMNLVLQCALGIKGVAHSKNTSRVSSLIKTGIIFASILLLWVFFSKIVASVIYGTFIYVLLFPISFVVYDGLEYLIFNQALKKDTENEYTISFSGGLTAASSFICINIANNFTEAFALAFGFACGTYLVFIILGEIRRRAALEAVPQFLRGKPLVLISMGMLSLVFSTVSILLFRMIGAG